MSSQPKISVIVPVYNVEKTLRRCLDSILEHSFKEYRIIYGGKDEEGSRGSLPSCKTL